MKDRLNFEEMVKDSFKNTALLSFLLIFRLKERIEGQKKCEGVPFVKGKVEKILILEQKTIEHFPSSSCISPPVSNKNHVSATIYQKYLVFEQLPWWPNGR